MRKLVTVRTIAELNPIPGADVIEVATISMPLDNIKIVDQTIAVGGWKVVVKKGEFAVGDTCVYFEIDSFLPEADSRYAFLMKSGVREFEGVRGHKLRTITLRGQISQGLALPITAFPEITEALRLGCGKSNGKWFEEGFQELLGVKKWEPEIPANLAGQVKGPFPSFIQKTDQERCQNLYNEIFVENAGARYEVTTKLDGSSCTIYFNNGELGVCSRNLELKINDENKDNAMVRALFDNLLNISLPALGRNLAVQGEIMGPGIQGNREGYKAPKFFIFDIYDIDAGKYLAPQERRDVVEKLRETWPPLEHVPVLGYTVELYDTLGIKDIDGLLRFAEGKSINHPVREGVVFKRVDGGFSFKAISNAFLAKEKD